MDVREDAPDITPLVIWQAATVIACGARGVPTSITAARRSLTVSDGSDQVSLVLRHEAHPDDVRRCRYAFGFAGHGLEWVDGFIRAVDWTVRYEWAFAARRRALGGEPGDRLPPGAWATHPVAAAVLRLRGTPVRLPSIDEVSRGPKTGMCAPRIRLPDAGDVASVVVAPEGLQLRLVRASLLDRHGHAAATSITGAGVLKLRLHGEFPETLEAALPGRPAGQLLECLAIDPDASRVPIVGAVKVPGRGCGSTSRTPARR